MAENFASNMASVHLIEFKSFGPSQDFRYCPNLRTTFYQNLMTFH